MSIHQTPFTSSPTSLFAGTASMGMGAFMLSMALLPLAGCSTVGAGAPRPALKAQATSQAPGFYRVPLGDFQITALSDGTLKIPLDRLMSNISQEEARRLLTEGFEPTPPESSVNAFLLHTGDKLLLIDAGSGSLYGETAGHLVENLRAAGYAPEDVDAVLITHLHRDHSGGLTLDGRRVFPRATVYVDRADRDFRFSAEAEARAPAHQKNMFPESRQALMPYEAAGKVVLFDGATQLFPGVRTRTAHGHTPGHTLYEVESQGQRVLFIGDLVHAAAVQFARPEVTVAFDADAHEAATDRANAFRSLAESRTLVGAAHISFPGLGYVSRGDGEGKGEGKDGKGAVAYRWTPRPYSR